MAINKKTTVRGSKANPLPVRPPRQLPPRPPRPPVGPPRPPVGPPRPPVGPKGVKSGKVYADDLSSWLSGPGGQVLGETQGPPGTYKTPFQDPNAMRQWVSQQKRFNRKAPRSKTVNPQDIDYLSNVGYNEGGGVQAKKPKKKKTSGNYVKKYAKGGGTRKVKR